MVIERVEKVSCQGRQIRNPDGLNAQLGLYAMGFQVLSIWFCFFSLSFFFSVSRDMLPRKHVVCVGVCVFNNCTCVHHCVVSKSPEKYFLLS